METRSQRTAMGWSQLIYVGILACVMLPFSLLSKGLESLIEYAVAACISSIPLVLWWMYFRQSKRVRDLYGHNMDGLRRRSAQR